MADMAPSGGRQTRRASGYGVKGRSDSGRPGIGVDAGGAPVIDPTENVLALVDAQARSQRDLDAAGQRFNASEVGWVIKHFEALMVAERRRIDDLALLKKDYDKAISETQTGQMKTTSDLVSTQLDKVTTSLSDTINKTADNIAATLATMDKRLAGVEQFRYETGGRASVSDPVLVQVANDLAALKIAGGKQQGQGEADSRKIVEAFQRTQIAHSGTSVAIQIAVGIIALLSLLTSVGGVFFIASRPTPPTPVYQAPSHLSLQLQRI